MVLSFISITSPKQVFNNIILKERYETVHVVGFYYIVFSLLLLQLILKCSIANVFKYYNLQKQYEMLLDIVTEYNSKGTFLSIQKKKSCAIKFIGLYKLFFISIIQKTEKQSYFKLEVKYSYIKTTLDSNKKIKKVLYKKIFSETSSI